MRLDANEVFGESGLTLEESQKERKEYVKNIGVEYRYGCYEEKRADSCHLLGDFREAIELNFKSAFQLYKDNCENRRYPKSCLKYAKYLMAGRECEANFSKAIEPLNVACDAKDAEACKFLALIYWNGDEQREPDSKAAESALRRSCEFGNGESCWLLSTWYMGPGIKFKGNSAAKNKKKGSLERDMQKSIEYGDRACNLNIYQSCANLMRIFKYGDGVPKDPDRSKEYYDKAKDIVNYLKDRTGTGFTA